MSSNKFNGMPTLQSKTTKSKTFYVGIYAIISTYGIGEIQRLIV